MNFKYIFKHAGFSAVLFPSTRKIVNNNILKNHLFGNKFLFGHIDFGFFENKRYLHTTVFIKCLNGKKEVIEKPIDEKKALTSIDDNKISELKDVTSANIVPKEKVKKPIWIRIKDELVHYYHGFKLFFFDLGVACGILSRLTKGHTLTRRERKQLVRTSADMARMLPFLVFIIVPFMEFLLPFYLKFFPFMLPSTFKTVSKDKDFTLQKLKGKLEIAKFLQEAIAESATAKNATKQDGVDLATFSDFLKQARESGLTVDTQDILRFSHLFEDEVTLESLNPKYLKALCKLLDINTIGPPALLRFQLEMKVRQLKVDDQMIANEGIDKIPVWELQQLSRERGMRSYGVNENRLRYQLSQWLSLSLEKKVPTTLLLLSRVMYLPETLTPEEQLKQAILVLPKTVSNTAKLKVDTEERVDPKTKLEVVKEEQKVIKEERIEASKASKEAEIISPEEVLIASEDKAPIIEVKPVESPDTAPTMEIHTIAKEYVTEKAEIQKEDKEPKPIPVVAETAIGAQDLAQIESAIANLEEGKTLFHKEEIGVLKESRKEISKILSTSDEDATVKQPEEKAVKNLSSKLDKMIDEIEKTVENIEVEAKKSDPSEEDKKPLIEEVMAVKSVDNIPSPVIKKERYINVSDVLKSIKSLEKTADHEKWQTILALLDEDKDGKIEMDHLVKMIKLLNSIEVKLPSSEITKLLEVIDKESIIAESKKEITPKENQ